MTVPYAELEPDHEDVPLRPVRLSLASSTSYLAVAATVSREKGLIFDFMFSSLDDIERSKIDIRGRGLGVLAVIGSLSRHGHPGENHIWEVFDTLDAVGVRATPTVFIPITALDLADPRVRSTSFERVLDISKLGGDVRKTIETGLALVQEVGVKHGTYV